MIDDVTLTTTTNRPVSIVGFKTLVPSRDPSGRNLLWEVAAQEGMVLRVCPETREVRLRLSFPRLANRHRCNYPLRPASAVNLGLTVDEVHRMVGVSFGAGVTGEKHRRWDEALNSGWGVLRIAFAVDVRVGDIPQLLEALAACPRRGNPPQRWQHPARGLQWESEAVRLQIYDKSLEIRGRIRQLRRQQSEFGQGQAELRERLAEEARNVVRFEVTLKNAKAIRNVTGLPGGWLPTLAHMSDEEVGAFVIGQQAAKLGLLPPPQPPEVDGVDALALARTLGESARRTSGGRRRGQFRGTTLAALGFLHQLRGYADPKDIQEALGLTARAYSERLRDLTRLGLPALGTADPSGHRHVARFARALLDEVGEFPPWLSSEISEDNVVEAPWADRLSGASDPDTYDDVQVEGTPSEAGQVQRSDEDDDEDHDNTDNSDTTEHQDVDDEPDALVDDDDEHEE